MRKENQGCGAGTGTSRTGLIQGLWSRNRSYSEYGTGSRYKKIKQTTQKTQLKF